MHLVIVENKGKSKGSVVSVSPTNLEKVGQLGVISVGKLDKYLVLDEDVPEVGSEFNVKKAIKAK